MTIDPAKLVTRLCDRLSSQPEGYRMSIGKILAIYSGLMVVTLLATIDQTIVATAGPAIVANLGGILKYSWVFTAYLLASAITIPVWGKLADVYGKRRPLLAAITLFLIGSMLCGAARSMPELIAFRAVQGLAGGGLMPLAHATVGSIVPLRDRGRFQGLMTSASATGWLVGPLVGGALVDHFSWPWIFYLNVPIAAVALAVIAVTMSNPADRIRRRPIDWPGAVLLATASSLLLAGLTEGGRQYAWDSAPIMGALGAAAVIAAAFGFVEHRSAETILPFYLLKNRVVTASIACIASSGLVQLGCIAYIPLYVQGVIGSTATSSGAVLIPMLAAHSLSSLAVGQFIARTGSMRPSALAGPACVAIGLGLLWRLTSASTPGYVASCSVLVGVGLGLMNQVFLLSVQNSVARSLIGSATALIHFARIMGGTLGVTVIAVIINHELPKDVRFAISSAVGKHRLAGTARGDLGHGLGLGFLMMCCLEAIVFFIVARDIKDVALRRSVDVEDQIPELA